jgi:hypothetical protein
MPSMKRRTMKIMAAVIPHCAYPGKKAISSVATPKPLTAMIVVRLRPIVSPRCPKIKAPTGRPSSVAAKIEPFTMAVVASSICGETKKIMAGASTTMGR